MSTSAERVAAAFAGGLADRPPIHHISFMSETGTHVLDREAYVGGGIQRWREAAALWNGPEAHAEFVERSYRDAIDLALAVGNDLVRMTYWRYPRKPCEKVDDCTFLFDDGETIMRFDPETEQCSIESIHPPEEITLADLEAQVEAMEASLATYEPKEETWSFELRAREELGPDKAIRVTGIGIGVSHDQVWMEAIGLEPELVRRHVDAQAEKAVRNVRFLAERGFKYLFGGNDFASQDGPMYSPASFRLIMLPGLQRISAECDKLGAKHLFASDGRLWPVARELFDESGIHGYYEIDRRAGMDLDRLRDEHPHLTLVGNISSHTLHLGTVDEVIAETTDCVETAVRRGGIVVGISNAVVVGTPPENLAAMLETIANYS